MLGSLVAFGLGAGGGAPPIYDPSASNLSVWLRGDEVLGTGATLDWSGRLSTGTSAGNGFVHSPGYLDEVIASATTLDGQPTVEWPVAATSSGRARARAPRTPWGPSFSSSRRT